MIRRLFVLLLVAVVAGQVVAPVAAAPSSSAAEPAPAETAVDDRASPQPSLYWSRMGWLATQSPDCDADRLGMSGISLITAPESYLLGLQGGDPDECVETDSVQKASVTDIYESGLVVNDVSQDVSTIQTNHIRDSDTYVWTIVKNHSVRGLNAGLNKSTVKDRINASLERYYTRMEWNLMATWQSNVHHIRYLTNVSRKGNLEEAIWAAGAGNLQWQRASTEGLDDVARTANYTLLNGSAREYTWLAFSKCSGGTMQDGYDFADPWNTTKVHHSFTSCEQSALGTLSGSQWWNSSYEVLKPSVWKDDGSRWTHAYPGDSYSAHSGNFTPALNVSAYYHLKEEINSSYHRMQDNAMKFVDDLYSTYKAGDIKLEEVLSAAVLAEQWNTEQNSTGYYGWYAAEAGLMGLNITTNASFDIHYTPNVDQVCTFNRSNFNSSTNTSDCHLEAGNKTELTGTLFTDWAPSKTGGDFVAGETYDTANATAPVYFVWQRTGDETVVVRLNGTFYIDTLTNVRTGEEINRTTLERQHRQTNDVTLTEEQLLELLNYRDNVSASYGSGGGGGGLNFGGLGLGGATGFIAIAVVIGAIALLLGGPGGGATTIALLE